MKRISMLLVLTISVLTITACSNEKEAAEDQTDAENSRQIVDTIVSSADIAYAAETLDELYAESDFVGEIEITSVSSSIVDGTDMISTTADFDVVTAYKGDAGNRSLTVGGGYMKLSEYADQLTWLDFSQYSEEETENGYICRLTTYTHIPEKGERLLVFCKVYDEGNQIYGTSPQQSIYVCDGDTITINSMETSGSWTDPLALDLEENYGAALTVNEQTVSVVCNRETILAALQE